MPSTTADRPVVLLNNEIMPYRVPLFNALADAPGFRFLVLFCTDRGWDREWKFNRGALRIPHRILPGFALRLRKPDYGEYRTIYINPSLFWNLARLRPRAIVAYEYSIPAMTALLYSRLSGCAYVVWTEGTPHSERHLTRGQRWTRRLAIPRAQAYLGTSSASCANLVALGALPERVYEALQSHAVRWFEQATRRARATRPADEDLVVLYVGFLNERKGVVMLLQAFVTVAQRQRCRLVLVGDGPLRPELERLARESGLQDRVQFRGFVQPEDMPGVYASADMFVLPSREDTFGVVAVEALASGLPLVCSRYAGVASHLEDGESALLVDPGDVPGLAERIERLLAEPALRARLAAEGQRVAHAFEGTSVARAFIDAVLAALAARAG